MDELRVFLLVTDNGNVVGLTEVNHLIPHWEIQAEYYLQEVQNLGFQGEFIEVPTEGALNRDDVFAWIESTCKGVE
jgi:hypothetical protein